MPTSLVTMKSVVVATSQQIASDLAGETVILNLKNGAYYGLNEIGVLVWNMIQKSCPVIAICDAIQEIYDVERAQGEQDIVDLLQDLATEELIEVSHAADTSAAMPILGR
jgi:hypothetical protein